MICEESDVIKIMFHIDLLSADNIIMIFVWEQGNNMYTLKLSDLNNDYNELHKTILNFFSKFVFFFENNLVTLRTP